MGLRENEVGEKEETDIGIERKPETRVSVEWDREGVFWTDIKGQDGDGMEEGTREEVPGENEPGPRLNEGEYRQYDPVHEPWCQLGRVGGTEGFIGCEYGEEEGDDGALESNFFGMISPEFIACWRRRQVLKP